MTGVVDLPLRSFSSVMGRKEVLTGSMVRRPYELVGDATAFAFKLHEESLLPAIRFGVMCYCTKMVQPSPGDIAYIKTKEGRDMVRVIVYSSKEDDGFATLTGEIEDEEPFSDVVEFIKFDDMVEIACVTIIGMHVI